MDVCFCEEKGYISICEKEKKWRLLASQTGVILLAILLLFLTSYLISVPLRLGGIVGEENEETAFRAVFFLLQAVSLQEILKAFYGTHTIPLISSTYLS